MHFFVQVGFRFQPRRETTKSLFAQSYLSNIISTFQTAHHDDTTTSTLDDMAAETPEIVAAGQPEKKVKNTASQAKKRKTAEAESATDTPAATPEGAEIVSDSPEAPPAKKNSISRPEAQIR